MAVLTISQFHSIWVSGYQRELNKISSPLSYGCYPTPKTQETNEQQTTNALCSGLLCTQGWCTAKGGDRNSPQPGKERYCEGEDTWAFAFLLHEDSSAMHKGVCVRSPIREKRPHSKIKADLTQQCVLCSIACQSKKKQYSQHSKGQLSMLSSTLKSLRSQIL